MSWSSLLQYAQTSDYYYALIDGLPYVVSSMTLPTSWLPGDYSQVRALDIESGIKDVGCQLNRKGGVASNTSMALRIGGPNGTDLLDWFFPSNPYLAPVTQSVTFVAATINVATTTGAPAAPGVVCLGPETVKYTGLTATSFTGVTRAQYGSEAEETILEVGYLKSSRYISSRPIDMEGRRVRLFQGLSNNEGQPLDLVQGGDYQREIWSGVINDIRRDDDWMYLRLSCESIQGIVDGEVGGYSAMATLGYTSIDEAGGASSWVSHMWGAYIPAGGADVRLMLEDVAAGTVAPITATLATGWTANLAEDICDAVRTALIAVIAPGVGEDVKVWCMLHPGIEPALIPFSDWEYWGYPPWDIRVMIGVKINKGLNAFNVSWLVDPGSPLEKLGFKTAFYSPMDMQGGLGEEFHIISQDVPPMLTVGPRDTEMLIWERPGNYAESFGATGYGILKGGNDSEVISWAGKTALGPTGLYILTGIERGRMDTTPLALRVETSDIVPDITNVNASPAAKGEAPTIETVIGFENEGIMSMFLKLCMSTGTPTTRHATYDSADLSRGQGLGLPSDYFDIATFEAAQAEMPDIYGLRSMLWTKPFNLKAWIGSELAPLGWTLITTQTDSGYQVSLARLNSPLMVSRYTLTHDDLTDISWPNPNSSRRDIANIVRLDLLWNVREEKFEKPGQSSFFDVDSRADYKVSAALSYGVKGLEMSVGTVGQVGELLGPALLSLFSRKYSQLRVTMDRRGWLFQPGDQVWLTLTKIVQGETQTLYNQQPMIITRVGKVYAGRGKQAQATIDLLHIPGRKLSYWAPSGEVSVYAAGPPPQITIKANEFTGAADVVPWSGELCLDYDFFVDGMQVFISNPGDEASRVSRTLSNKAGATFDLNRALPAGLAAGAVVTFPEYRFATTWQELFVFIADNSGTLGPDDDAAFRWSE